MRHICNIIYDFPKTNWECKCCEINTFYSEQLFNIQLTYNTIGLPNSIHSAFPMKVSKMFDFLRYSFLLFSQFLKLFLSFVSFHLWYLCHNGPQNVITTFIILIISDISWNIMVIRTFRWCDVQQVVTMAGVIDKLYRHPPAASLHNSTNSPRGIESINRY